MAKNEGLKSERNDDLEDTEDSSHSRLPSVERTTTIGRDGP